ncbi:hypothetical protein [Actinomadura rudentiformis]|uniref:Uncharacterized protein n=1 Tax=Actinomadura rudentiformis TaxID=359158 RepID=A0A6H9YV69_9ACTN|nr:hypothetical protein [Actinomadura rudentiformis]KAB2350969.1 hypothetical protein F8566_08445 [Actinomadura rudentiformis]
MNGTTVKGTTRLVYAGLGAMVVFTGGYVVVYLARWEWQRALMAGELLLISLVVLLAVAGAHRLARLERRLSLLIENTLIENTQGRPAPPGVHEPRLSAVPSPREAERSYAAGEEAAETPSFRWLAPEPESYKVFIPVLLGAGIMVSGLAALVERMAAALGGSARRAGAGSGTAFGQVRAPASLALPSGGVLAGAPDLSPPPGPDRRRRLKVAAIALAVLAVAALIVIEMAEHTQDRPDSPVDAAASTLIIEASTNGPTGAATVDPLATRLWEYCRGSTRPYLDKGGLAPLGDRQYALVVRPALGEHALRRLRGCLEDAVIDHGSFRVVSVQPEPADD